MCLKTLTMYAVHKGGSPESVTGSLGVRLWYSALGALARSLQLVEIPPTPQIHTQLTLPEEEDL